MTWFIMQDAISELIADPADFGKFSRGVADASRKMLRLSPLPNRFGGVRLEVKNGKPSKNRD